MTNYLVFFNGERISYQHGYDLPGSQNLIVPPRAHHDMYEILYVLKGSVHHSVNGAAFDLCGGELLLININAIHQLNIDLKTEYERFALHFNPSLIARGGEFLFEPFKGEPGRECAVFTAETVLKTQIPAIFEKLEQAMKVLPQNPELLLSAYITELLYEIYGIHKDAPQKLPVKINALIKKTVDYIETNLYLPLEVEKIAADLFADKFYISHLFKKNIGLSIKEYIIKKKMDIARRMLKNENMPATTVADKLGYKNYNVFYKSYVKLYGESPSGIPRGGAKTKN